MKKTVLNLMVGEEGLVSGYTDDSIGSRLLSVGIVPNSRIQVIRKSPLGSALVLQIDHTQIAVRRQEAKTILLS